MTYRLRNITIAIALAVVAALLTAFYVKNYERDVQKNETNVPVYVAKVDIPSGTSRRFEPGASRQVAAVAFQGRRRIPGLQIKPESEQEL